MHIIKSQEELVAQAQRMAADFAKLKAKDYCKIFLNDSNLSEELFALYEKEAFKNGRSIIDKDVYINHLSDDYEVALGKVLALAYAIGAIDSAEKLRPDFYKKALKPSTKAPSELSIIRPQGDE